MCTTPVYEHSIKRKSIDIPCSPFLEPKKVKFNDGERFKSCSQVSITKKFTMCKIDEISKQDTNILYCDDETRKTLSGTPIIKSFKVIKSSESKKQDTDLLYDFPDENKENCSRNSISIRTQSDIASCNQSFETASNASFNISLEQTPNYFTIGDTPLTFDKINEIGTTSSMSINKVPLRRIKTTPASMNNYVSPIVYHKKDNRYGLSRQHSQLITTTTTTTIETSDDWEIKDISYLSANEVADIVSNDFAAENARFHIIDCRYPYEYEGGHIDGAVNIYTPVQLLNYVFREERPDSSYKCVPNSQEDQEKAMESLKNAHSFENLWWLNDIFIFHCEYSSKRAPRMASLLRQVDRYINYNRYPELSIPKVCILRGGYEDFFKHHSKLCYPTTYVKMDLDNSFGSYEPLNNNRFKFVADAQMDIVRSFLISAKKKQSLATNNN